MADKDAPIYELLKAHIDQRAAKGLAEYGDYLRASTGVDLDLFLLEELLDAACYQLAKIEKAKEMAYHKFSKRKDDNHDAILEALRAAGYDVVDTHNFGQGFPDIVVNVGNGVSVLLEIKTAKGELTPSEKTWHAAHPGAAQVVRSAEDALTYLEQFRALIFRGSL